MSLSLVHVLEDTECRGTDMVWSSLGSPLWDLLDLYTASGQSSILQPVHSSSEVVKCVTSAPSTCGRA